MKASPKLRCLKGGAGVGGGGGRETTPISITRKKIRVFEKLRADLWADKENTPQFTFNRVRTHLESP